MLRAFMLRVAFSYCDADCRYGECHYAEFQCAECRDAEFGFTLLPILVLLVYYRCHNIQHNDTRYNRLKFDTQHNDTQRIGNQIFCLVPFMFSVTIKSTMPNAIMPNAIMPSVIMLNVIMLNVVAP
jgi:hypothetical protein